MDPSGSRVTLEASGDKGLLEFDSRENPSLRTHKNTSVQENNYAMDDDPYFQQLRAFVEMVRGTSPPAVTAEEGLAAVQLACAAIESAEAQEVVWLD